MRSTATLKLTLLSTALAVCALPALAQSTGAAPATTPQTIRTREENQQDRIAQGVKSGELTPGETASLEKKESNVNGEIRGMRKEDDGHLTAADKATLNRQQNQLSKQIYHDKHNAAVENTNPKSEVGKREE